jgi:hypothetical protein
MDEASLTFTAGLAPIVNNGTVATLGNVNNANDIPNNEADPENRARG